VERRLGGLISYIRRFIGHMRNSSHDGRKSNPVYRAPWAPAIM
jgi:hypothetical protein